VVSLSECVLVKIAHNDKKRVMKIATLKISVLKKSTLSISIFVFEPFYIYCTFISAYTVQRKSTAFAIDPFFQFSDVAEKGKAAVRVSTVALRRLLEIKAGY